jgi:hypothetical protein
MAPLILHNVPDEELYVGDDGVKRPYAMVFPQYGAFPTSPLSPSVFSNPPLDRKHRATPGEA